MKKLNYSTKYLNRFEEQMVMKKYLSLLKDLSNKADPVKIKKQRYKNVLGEKYEVAS